MFGHCAQARHAWNLAWEVNSTYRKGGARTTKPVRYVGMAAMLADVRRTPTGDLTTEEADYFVWVASGNAEVQQQALRDFDQALANFFNGSHGYPGRRKKYRHEGFRVIGTGRAPAWTADGEAVLNAKGKQVVSRQVRVEKLNKKWAQIQVPGCGWVKFRNTRRALPDAKTFRVTHRAGRWYVSFAVVPDPVDAPGDGSLVGIDRGVVITAALSDGRTLNCPQLTARERAQVRKYQRRAARAPKGSPQRRAAHAEVARLRESEANRRKDWCEKTSTTLARSFDTIRFEDLKIKNMTRSARGTVEEPGRRVAQKAGLNRVVFAQGWGLLRARTGHKPLVGWRISHPSTRVCGAATASGSTRTRARAKPSSSVPAAVSPATPTPTPHATSRQDRAGLPTSGPEACAGGTTPHQRSSVREPR
ncbi:RNA-guided endonuclease InsQ/TnpB family protein [Nocardiopsis sp. PBL]